MMEKSKFSQWWSDCGWCLSVCLLTFLGTCFVSMLLYFFVNFVIILIDPYKMSCFFIDDEFRRGFQILWFYGTGAAALGVAMCTGTKIEDLKKNQKPTEEEEREMNELERKWRDGEDYRLKHNPD